MKSRMKWVIKFIVVLLVQISYELAMLFANDWRILFSFPLTILKNY